MDFPASNNLHLLRLLFAMQVVVVHVIELSGGHARWLGSLPGVPAFFFLSGFLIYASYLHTNDLRTYASNRLLRLLPALVLVTVVSAAMLVWLKGITHVKQHLFEWAAWFVGQVTLGQIYNPQIFRDVGIGVINGPLWTITVEILFYIAIPVLVWLDRKHWIAIPLLIGLSLVLQQWGAIWFAMPVTADRTVYDFLMRTPLMWGWMFGFGILACKYYAVLSNYIAWMVIAIIPMMILVWLDSDGTLNTRGNSIGVIYFLLYALLILYAAFHLPAIRLKPDFSYGLYIWHAPVINFLLVVGGTAALSIAPVMAIAMACAMASWYTVEAPALRLKKRSLIQDKT